MYRITRRFNALQTGPHERPHENTNVSVCFYTILLLCSTHPFDSREIAPRLHVVKARPQQ